MDKQEDKEAISCFSKFCARALKKVKVSPFTPWRHIGKAEVQLHSFLMSALGEGELLHAPAVLPQEKTAGTH